MIQNLLTRRRGLVAALATLAALFSSLTTAQAGLPGPQPGSPDSGDSLFPHQGNGGYDVDSYAIRLTWTRPNHIEAVTRVHAVASQDLSSFNLDLYKLTIRNITVDGDDAVFSHAGSEVAITPSAPIATGSEFTVRVQYHGRPTTYVDPDGSADGWIKTGDGATVLSEPVGAMTWFPNNDTPRDKATVDVRVTAPRQLEVVSNGRLRGVTTAPHTRSWHWQSQDQIAPYLMSVSIGQYDQVLGKTRNGIPLRSYFDPTMGGKRLAARLPKMLGYWQKLFGPYPFESGGIIIDDVPVGYALEVQTRPVFPYIPDTATLVHELAHQWFGDSVTPVDWSDIWLNEGFATYAEWLWEARTHPRAPQRHFRNLYDGNPDNGAFWNGIVAAPGDPANMFRTNVVYLRGAMALQALRITIGDDDFFTLLHRWPTVYREGNATTAQLQAMAQNISGQNLTILFDDWLYTEGKPPAL
jgi:aminopeptidase N